MGKRQGDRKRRLELLERKVSLETEQSRIARQIVEADADLGVKLPTPLDNVRVATPCAARWEEMSGDDRRRFCAPCGKEVFNISAMTLTEAEDFLASRFGRSACIQLFFRADGTAITRDCTVGRPRAPKLRLAVSLAAAAAAAGLAFSTALSLASRDEAPKEATRVYGGGIAVAPGTSQAVYK